MGFLLCLQGPGPQVYPRRLAPYPSPAMHMSQKRQQQGYPNPGPGPQMQPGFSPAGGPQVQSILVSVTYTYTIFTISFMQSFIYTINLQKFYSNGEIQKKIKNSNKSSTT